MKAAKMLEQMKVWDLLPDPPKVRAFINRQMRTEGLRAYLISSYAHYDAIGLDVLAARFELSENEAHSIISKMMLDSELHACWDQPTSTLVVQRTEPSKLQFLALQFADKAAQFVEANERTLDSRTGSYGYKQDSGYDRERGERGERGYQRR